MNPKLKHALHVIGLALATALLMGAWDVLSAMSNVIIPALKSGIFPKGYIIVDAFFPALAKAIGGSLEAFMTVAALYAAKIKFLGSSADQSQAGFSPMTDASGRKIPDATPEQAAKLP
jgi:TRAP-type C4-dicarboxylate transport system permease small subunit